MIVEEEKSTIQKSDLGWDRVIRVRMDRLRVRVRMDRLRVLAMFLNV